MSKLWCFLFGHRWTTPPISEWDSYHRQGHVLIYCARCGRE